MSHLGAIAITPEQATRPRSRLMKWLVSHQGWYFFPILPARRPLTALRRDSAAPSAAARSSVDGSSSPFWRSASAASSLSCFWCCRRGRPWPSSPSRLAVFGFYLGSAFAPNHIGMPLVSPRLKLDFLRRQVLMSRNVSGGRLIAILMGGLNYQVEHHLFPSMARPSLRKVQPLVAAYCAAAGVPYTQTTLWQSYGAVIRYLNSVGLRGRTLPLPARRATSRLVTVKPGVGVESN
mgnify:CR=1 FL=1